MSTSPTFLQYLKDRLWPAIWSAFGRTFVLLGLALLGWGADNLTGFFAHPARAGLAAVALASGLFLGWLRYRTPPQPHHAHDPEHWHYSLAELVFILAAFGDRRNVLTWAENPSLRWVGLAIYLLASFYFAWANLTWVTYLRREVENSLEVPALLPSGPYRWTRYPTLLALFLQVVGFVLVFRSWVGLVFLLPLLWVIFRRARIWDQELIHDYPPRGATRCQTSKSLIPFIY